MSAFCFGLDVLITESGRFAFHVYRIYLLMILWSYYIACITGQEVAYIRFIPLI